MKWIVWLAAWSQLTLGLAAAQESAPDAGQVFRLYEGVTAYVWNPEGKDFTVALDVRDLNLSANGPREVLFKIYDPDGRSVVREIIPDDGCTPVNPSGRTGGWDHDLQSFITHYANGLPPPVRWSAWSDPAHLKTLVARTFERPIKGGKKGIYRIVLAGTPDHYVTLRLSPALAYGVAGHPAWMYGHGALLKKRFVYVPKNTSGIFFAVAEPDEPRTRRFKLTAPDGKVLFDGMADGGYVAPKMWTGAAIEISPPGAYDGQVLGLEVSEGQGDYLVKVTLQQPKVGAFADYVGMGSSAVFSPDQATALALQGGATVVDGEVFWHPFHVRFHQWLKANKLDATDAEKSLRKELEAEFNGFRLLETGDARGSATFVNLAYGMGYYGCKIFRPGWVLMRRDDVPAGVKDIIREGLIMGGDRLGFATHTEKVNGNAFAQINVALWYCHRATGDDLQKERFETFWQRWTTEGWGIGSGLSRSGDAQEFLAHDAHYGSYIMDNWKPTGNTWVREGGILGDAGDDPRFQKVMDRYRELYSYLYCREANGTAVAANPWSARTHMHPHNQAQNWEIEGHTWKGEPGPDFTVSVNGGNEWFAARRKGYYSLTFHGRLAPEWTSQCFEGQIGFGGGMLCQVTVPGRGPVIASTLTESYGKGMHPSNWRNFHIHALVGERWDGAPVISGIGEHEDARLDGQTVASTGEICGAHLKVTRRYTYRPEVIECSVQLAQSDYARAMSIWSHERHWSEMRVAYEMIPFLPKAADGKTATVVTTAEGEALTNTAVTTRAVRVDRGGFGVEIQLEQPLPVSLGSNDTVLIHVVGPGSPPTPAERIGLQYKLAPFGGKE